MNRPRVMFGAKFIFYLALCLNSFINEIHI